MADNNSSGNNNNNNNNNNDDAARNADLARRFAALGQPPQGQPAAPSQGGQQGGRGGFGGGRGGSGGGRGGSGRGQGGPANFNQPRFCSCGNQLGPQDRTKCVRCRGANNNSRGALTRPAAAASTHPGSGGQLSAFADIAQQIPMTAGGDSGAAAATGMVSMVSMFGMSLMAKDRAETADREERRAREERDAGRREREEREKGSRRRSASPDRRPRRNVAHLEAPKGRVVDQPCRGCIEAGRERAAHTHYDHECKHKDALGRRSALRRYEAQKTLPAPHQPLLLTAGAETTGTATTAQRQLMPPPPPPQEPSGPASEDDASLALRNNLESFARENNIRDPLQAAENYRNRLGSDRLEAILAGRSVDIDGRIFVWLDIYINWLRNGGH